MNYKKLNNLLGSKNFVLLLSVWLMLNSIKYISTNPISQFISIGFGFWGVVVIIMNVFSKEDSPFNIKGTGLAVPFIIAVFLSFLGNGLISPVKNLYSVIAVSINFLVLYTYIFTAEKEDLRKLMTVILIGTTLINIVNISMLLFRISIQTGDLSDIKQVTFIGYDTLRGRMTGLSGNANGLSRVALCGLIASSYFVIIKNKVKMRGIYIIPVLVHFLVLILSESRAGIYSISAAIGLMFFVYMFKIRENKSTVKLVSILLSLVIVFGSIKALTIGGKFAAENFPSIQTSITPDKDTDGSLGGLVGRDDEATNGDSSNGRITLMKNGIAATLKYNPIFGLSYSNATTNVSKYIEEENITIPDHLKTTVGSMHNTIVQSFVYYGILGVIPLTIFFAYMIFTFVRFVLDKNLVQEKNKSLLLFSVFVIGIMIPMNMVEWIFVFDFDNHLINLLMFVSLGLFIKIVEEENPNSLTCKMDEYIRNASKKLVTVMGGKK